MPLQAGLPGIDAAAGPTDRLFFALFPDDAARDAIAIAADGLRAEHSLHGRPLRSDRLHMTLHHLGDHAGLRDDIVRRASQAAGEVDVPAFDVRLDSVASFSNRNRRGGSPLVLLCAEREPPVQALWKALRERLLAVGEARHVERRFTPHVTLLYDGQVLPPQPLPPIRWRAREFVLVHSLLGRSTYAILGRWQLRDAAAP